MISSEELDSIYDELDILNDSSESDEPYSIGLCMSIMDDLSHKILIGMKINVALFYKYPISIIQSYLSDYSLNSNIRVDPLSSQINIFKLFIDKSGCYLAIVKTHWIRLIQRHWKYIYRLKQEQIKKQKAFAHLKYREIKGRIPFPTYGLRGLMSVYQ
jgi:hypothetical protein